MNESVTKLNMIYLSDFIRTISFGEILFNAWFKSMTNPNNEYLMHKPWSYNANKFMIKL